MWKPIAVPKPLTAGVALRPPLYYMVGVEQGASSAVALAPAEIRSRRMPDYQVKNVEPVAVGADVQVRVFTLTDGEEIPWHYHSESTDHYFVLRGKLTIETRSPHHRHRLDVGESYKILPGTAHHAPARRVAQALQERFKPGPEFVLPSHCRAHGSPPPRSLSGRNRQGSPCSSNLC
jgi:quercetin dioxygenase-like cupin family protein